MTRRRQRGVALLVALLAVALGTVLLAMLLDASGVALARTRNVARAQQADAYATGLEDWAIDLLRRDGASGDPRDTRGDLWARPLPPTPVPGGRISGTMRDLNGCFNLNSLAATSNQMAQDRFRRLLRALKLDSARADAVVDWVDDGGVPELRGAEDAAYLAADPPYRTANRLFADASELRLVRGFDAETWAIVAPHVCALPSSETSININTATLPVLMSIDDAITEQVAKRVTSEGAAQFGTVDDFLAALQKANVVIVALPGDIGVSSEWFVARADIELDGLPMAYAALIQRGVGGFRVVSRNRAM